jgi:anti-anti-sigma factor
MNWDGASLDVQAEPDSGLARFIGPARRRNVMSASLHRSNHRDGKIRVVPEADDIVVLTLEGDFDLANAPKLGEQLDRVLEANKDLILDLSEVTFIDSSVINELFRAARVAKESGQTAVLQLGTAPNVERILEIVGIESVLPCADRRHAAIKLIESGVAEIERRAVSG